MIEYIREKYNTHQLELFTREESECWNSILVNESGIDAIVEECKESSVEDIEIRCINFVGDVTKKVLANFLLMVIEEIEESNENTPAGS